MAGNVTENFNELCRLCASKINLLVGINIFEAEGNARKIVKKISSCLPIQVHEADRLPKMICSDCVYKLESFFTFREKSMETENLLLELINKTKINSNKMDPKVMNVQQTINIVTNIDDQQLIVPNHSQELLESTNISLTHLTDRDNIIVNQEIVLNTHDNIVMHNHELENIEIAPNELNSHNMSHDNLHNHQLMHQHATMAQLVQQEIQMTNSHLNVQNLDLMHPQHPLINDTYGDITEKNLDSEDNCIDDVVLSIKEQNKMVSIVKIEEDIKKENQANFDIKTNYSEGSESDESEIPNEENNKDPILIENDIYDDNNALVNTPELSTSETSDTLPFYCNMCGIGFNDREIYFEHYGEHMNKCLTCQIDFENVDTLKEHRRKIHASNSASDKDFQTRKMRTRYKTDNNFMKEATSDEDYEEGNNSSREENSSEFVNDQDDDGDNENDDNKSTKRKRWEPKVCTECGKSYKTNYKLMEHMRKHTGETPFKCTICEKAFRSKIGLAQHVAKHTGQFDYSCPTCGKGFQCKSYLIVHQRVHSTLKPYPCGTCGKNFKTKQSLLDHENRHLGVKPYMCDICGRGFITKGLCKSHQKIHSGRDNRQFPCTVCNKLFVSKSYLNTHVKIHTGEKPFICEVCGKGFLTRVDLKIHSTMHTGEKSFVCEICGKAFARRDALRCHRRSHTGERPYRCDVCGQTFTQFSPMAIHKRLHTGERPYSCDVCRKTFVSRSTMMSHKKKHNHHEINGSNQIAATT